MSDNHENTSLDAIHKQFVSSPDILAGEAQKYARDLKEGEITPFFIPELDLLNGGISLPMRRGEVIIFQARPGNAKTTFGLALLNRIGENMPIERRPVFVTRETIVEDTAVNLMAYLAKRHLGKEYSVEDFYTGAVPEMDIVRVSNELGRLNMLILGRKRANFGKDNVETLDIETIYGILKNLMDGGITPAVLALDYLQKFDPVDSCWRDSKADRVMRTMQEIEELALTLGIPTIVLAQAGRQVDDYALPISGMNDIQWSSEAEKVASRVYSLWRPATSKKHVLGKAGPLTLQINDEVFINSQFLLVVEKLKERGTKGIGTAGIWFHPGTLEIASLEEKTIAMNDLQNRNSQSTNAPRQGAIEI